MTIVSHASDAALFHPGPPPEGSPALVEGVTKGAAPPGLASLVPRIEGGPRRVVPASFGQASLWFLRQVMPYPSSYNTAVQFRLAGELDALALLAAVREVVRRHESLRTTFTVTDGTVAQVVWDDLTADVSAADLTSHPDPEAEARSRARALAAEPFDLDHGPLLRVRLLRVGPRDHLLVVVVDHIVADGTSLGILWREIEALYPAFRADAPSPLPPPATQYAECVEAQSRWLQTPAFARQLAYWTSHLAGAAACDLPTDRPRGPIRSYRGDLVVVDIPSPIVARLRAACARDDVSLFASLLAALDVLLARYSGQRDVVVMVPMAGRQRFAADAVIGYFANMVMLRTEVQDDLELGELVRRVNKEIMAGVFRQDVPFAKVVEALRPDRSLSDDPLARIALSFFAAPGSTLSLPGVASTFAEIPNGGAKFDLSLIITERADDLTVSAEYNTDVFDAATLERMLAGFCALLEAAASRPSLRLHELPILPAAEAARLLALAGGEATFPVDACLHELFQAQAARTPDAVAVRFEAESVTYAELDRRARQVARALQRRGVGPETLVGLAVDRGVDLVVGILGILAAGGAYLPLDPDYPRSRLAFMIEDARVPVVVTLARHAHLFEPESQLQLLRLDADAEAIARETGSLDPLSTGVRPSHLAYVIYTSGSTGNPKGVMVEHRHVVRLFHATDAWYRFHAGDVWTMFHSYAFDFSVWELWGALLYGGRLVVVPRSVARAPDAFLRLLVDEQVTVLNQTPSAFRQLVDAEGAGDAAARPALALRYVIFGGEALRVSDLEPFWRRHGDERPALVNMYGITETTVHVTYRPLRRADLERPWSSVIGAPIPDLSLHVLDAQRRPVPVGVPGELYVGGAGVARGYLRRAELTADRFLDDPFDARSEGRLYRTGDLARRLDDGEIEYLGRIDHQVKIRGYRVELGEIEAALTGHPAVREAVVVAREDRPGDVRLVAYVVPLHDGAASGPKPQVAETLDVTALRAFLAERLLEPMVPAAFVVLAALPLTSNGKLDRRALPAPDDRAAAQGTFVAPRTPAEELCAGIWADVLGLDQVSVTDDFFALGGHSLLGMRVIARLSAAFDVDLPVRTLFEARTVASLAERGEAARQAGARPAAPPITPTPRNAELPLSFAQQRMWVLDQIEPDSAAYNMPAALRLTGLLDVPALGQSLTEITRRHEALRTTFPAVEGQPRQLIAAKPSLPLPVVDLAALAGPAQEAEVRRRSAAEARQPFHLAAGPMVRATLLRLSEREHVLLLTMHHITGDGWSMGVLLRELGALYEAFHEGRPSPLPELSIQYADYTAWQRRWLSGKVLDEQLAYWKRQLDGAPPVLDLPTDRPRPAQQTFRGATLRGRLSAELTATLEATSRREGVTLFMTLLAALQTLLHLYAGQDDIVVGSPIAGRTRPEIEDLVGFFANTLLLRTDLSGDPTFRELLGREREVTLGAYDHQEMPFERLVEELRVERNLSHNPLFQVMLVLQNTPPSTRALGDLSLAEEPVEMITARFDLLLDVSKVDEALSYSLTYSTDLFDDTTVAQMSADLTVLLERFAANPAQPLSAARAWLSRRTLDLAVVATFTAEPLEDSLSVWTRELGMLSRVRFAPFGQVFQELLDPTSLLGRNREGANVLLVRFEDWMQGATASPGGGGQKDLDQSIDELILALRAASQRCPAPHVVVLCPPSPAVLAQPDVVARFQRLETSLAAALAITGGTHLVTSAEIAALYPVSDVHDPYSDSVGHVPYTPLYFAALGTAVVRRLSAILGSPYKVIVLDCDQTLWKGIVGEAGAAGVELDPPRRLLQERMVEQHEQGMLLCLCSKNNEADVLEVFERRPEMPLRMEHVVSHRINWRPKSENLVSLAEELQLGLDSFVFVDDSPVECAEVKARCPDVMVVELPADPARIPQALRHVWAFDHLTRSKEDQQRTALYRQNAQRERLRNEVPTLVEFVAGLGLEVTTSPIAAAHTERVSQLTQRTNQFNVTTIRRTESDLQQRLASGELEGLVTEVRDRFGDYGLVGAILFSASESALQVDTFLLSCRALGRGVELRMLLRLGAIARERGLPRIELPYRRSKKNKPALELLERVGHAFQRPATEGYLFDLPTEHVLSLDVATYLSHAESELPTEAPPAAPAAQTRRAFVVPDHVPTSLDKAEKVLEKARARRHKPVSASHEDAGPRGALEVKLLAIWEELLGVKGIGVHDSFFDVGGHSLLAMRLFDRIERSLGVKLPVAMLFQAPTIAQIGEILQRKGWEPSWSSLVPIQTSGSRQPFFCVHAVGGNVLNYRLLSRHLGPDQPFYGLQARGLGGNEPPHTTVEEMAADYIREMRQEQPRGPYALGGASGGGVVAYEMAQQLHATGERVSALVMLDTYRAGPPPARVVEARGASWFHRAGMLVDYHLGNLLLRTPRQGLSYLADRVRARFGGTAGPIQKTIQAAMPAVRHVIESNMHAIVSYVPRPYPGTVVMLLSCDEPDRAFYDGRLAWADLLDQGLLLRFIPGSHENMLDEPQVAGVAAVIARCLA